MSEIVFTPAALRQRRKLDPDLRSRMRNKLTRFAETGEGDVKRLKGRAGIRLRVRDWRVICYTQGDTLVIAAVGNRRDIYD